MKWIIFLLITGVAGRPSGPEESTLPDPLVSLESSSDVSNHDQSTTELFDEASETITPLPIENSDFVELETNSEHNVEDPLEDEDTSEESISVGEKSDSDEDSEEVDDSISAEENEPEGSADTDVIDTEEVASGDIETAISLTTENDIDITRIDDELPTTTFWSESSTEMVPMTTSFALERSTEIPSTTTAMDRMPDTETVRKDDFIATTDTFDHTTGRPRKTDEAVTTEKDLVVTTLNEENIILTPNTTMVPLNNGETDNENSLDRDRSLEINEQNDKIETDTENPSNSKDLDESSRQGYTSEEINSTFYVHNDGENSSTEAVGVIPNEDDQGNLNVLKQKILDQVNKKFFIPTEPNIDGTTEDATTTATVAVEKADVTEIPFPYMLVPQDKNDNMTRGNFSNPTRIYGEETYRVSLDHTFRVPLHASNITQDGKLDQAPADHGIATSGHDTGLPIWISIILSFLLAVVFLFFFKVCYPRFHCQPAGSRAALSRWITKPNLANCLPPSRFSSWRASPEVTANPRWRTSFARMSWRPLLPSLCCDTHFRAQDTCFLCLREVPAKEWDKHRRVCALRNKDKLDNLSATSPVTCFRCSKFLRALPAYPKTTFVCDRDGCEHKRAHLSTSVHNRYNCYLCDFDLCAECVSLLLKNKELEDTEDRDQFLSSIDTDSTRKTRKVYRNRHTASVEIGVQTTDIDKE